MSQISTKLYEFGAFRLDASQRVLWRGEELIVLPSKVFDTLWMLVKEEGRVVSKSELMEAIWADSFVEESNVSQNIYTLRRTLGVDEQGRQFIETIPRRGYRFAVPVKLLEEVSNGGVSANNSQTLTATQAPLAAPSAPEVKEIRPRSALRNAIFAGLGILVLAAIGFGVYQFINRRGEMEKIAPIEQLRIKRLTNSGDVLYPTISPDGEKLAYVRLEEEQSSVWVKQIATGSDFQILPPSRESYRSLAFSPDGQYLFFREENDPGGIYQTATFGGTMKKVADNVWSNFSVSPDGKRLAFVRRDAARNAQLLILSDIEYGGDRELGVRHSPMEYGEGAPAWSPDGSKLVVAGGLEQRNLLAVDVSTGKERELRTPRWRTIAMALWTPDGKHLIFSARATGEPTSQLWMLAYPDGVVSRLTNDLESYFWISLSADGRNLVTRQQIIFSHLWLAPGADLKKARQLTFGRRNFDGYVGVAWTPDGKIIFSALAGNITDLYSMNPDGSNRVQLTANAGQDNEYPVVSNDGRYIVFTSNRARARQIWRMDIDGRNQKQLTFGAEEKESAHYAALSADDREVYFIKRGAGPPAIWKVSIEGGTPAPVSRLTDAAAEGALSISPDGKWLAYHHVSTSQKPREERTTRIGALPTEGPAELKLFDLPMRRPITQWSADSTAFDYAAGTFISSSLWRQPISGGEAQKLCDFPDRVFNFAWSRDRKNLAVSRGLLQGDALSITNLP
ncbi:MAG TPA: winged helix-turn-helix domain-containing protein [Blastocatellia bacterium]|nr:winged helix-turn-helix domain-containing protein [Blastocatellia bacterium]